MARTDGLLLGLDAGNTVIKAVLFDAAGNQLAASKRDGVSSTPRPGHVERDMNELWANAAVVIRECIEKAGVRPSEIAAVGCAGHGISHGWNSPALHSRIAKSASSPRMLPVTACTMRPRSK